MRRMAAFACVCACVIATTGPHRVCLASDKPQTAPVAGVDEPQARAIYQKMVEAFQSATTLSYECAFRNYRPGADELAHGIYRVWMKRPNYFRVETSLGDDNRPRGVLIGDGQFAWGYWPAGRPEFSGEEWDAYQKTRLNVYMKEPAPPGRYAIRYATIMKKNNNHFAIIDPARFFGVACSLEPLIDWMRRVGVEQAGKEECDVIEISYMGHQRSCFLWLSVRDHLPRRLKRIVRGNKDLVDEEQWSRLTLNGDIPQERFVWQPPEGWQQWQPPAPEDRLLKPGQPAPDFELASADGGKIRLSAYSGNIVWLTFWRVQCPPCRDEIPYLQKLYEQNKDNGLVVLGFNFADDVKSASDFLHEHSATFPNIIDASDQAVRIGFFTYGARAAPVNYIIDREGKVAAAWLGYEEGRTRGIEALAGLGVAARD